MDYTSIYVIDKYLLSRYTYKSYFHNLNDYYVLGDFQDINSCLIQMRKQDADVIIMDIELPEINGIEGIQLIKHKFPKTKIIVATSYKDEDKIIASLVSGACGYVVKNRNMNFEKIIKIIAQGGFWMDLEVANFTFSQMPTPNIQDIENLYENRKMKDCLTLRELEVLKLLTAGKTNSEIAKEIIISTNTAKAHVGSILTKLQVNDRVQAAVKAVKANLF